VWRQGHFFQSNCTEKRLGIVAPKDYLRKFLLSVYFDPRATNLKFNGPPVTNLEDGLRIRCNSELSEEVRRKHGVRGPRVHSRLDRLEGLRRRGAHLYRYFEDAHESSIAVRPALKLASTARRCAETRPSPPQPS